MDTQTSNKLSECYHRAAVCSQEAGKEFQKAAELCKAGDHLKASACAHKAHGHEALACKHSEHAAEICAEQQH